MTSPPPYVITRDYSDYQAAHQLPGPAIAGSDLDSEFNNLVVTTNAIINNLNLLQRSDGALNNQSVTPDTINSALAIMIAGWNIRGPWVTATVYALKDYVTNGGNGYVCIIANTGGTFATDLAAGKWALVSTIGATGPQGVAGATGPTGPAGPVAPTFRNRLINGDFRIDQRNAGVGLIITSAAAYTVDRWYAGTSGAGTQSISAQQVVGSGVNKNALQITGAGANTATILGQKIESANCADLINQDLVCSLIVSSPSIATVTWTAYRANSTDSWGGRTQIATGSFGITSSPTAYNFTFNAGSGAGSGLSIEFTTGTLTFSSTILYQQIQLELGTTPSAFERRPIAAELAMCQRHFAKSYEIKTAPGAATRNGITGMSVALAVSTGTAPGEVRYPVALRGTPAVLFWDGAGNASKCSSLALGSSTWTDNLSAGVVAPFGINSSNFFWSGSNAVANASVFLHYTADAEL